MPVPASQLARTFPTRMELPLPLSSLRMGLPIVSRPSLFGD